MGVIFNFEAELAEAIAAEIRLHMDDIEVLVKDTKLSVEDYYNMSFMNRLSDLAQKAEKARNEAENQYELAEDYWTVDELPGYLEEAAKFAREARAKATDAQTLLTEAVKAADDIKSMVYTNQGSVSLEELAADVTRKVKEI